MRAAYAVFQLLNLDHVVHELVHIPGQQEEKDPLALITAARQVPLCCQRSAALATGDATWLTGTMPAMTTRERELTLPRQCPECRGARSWGSVLAGGSTLFPASSAQLAGRPPWRGRPQQQARLPPQRLGQQERAGWREVTRTG